VRLWISASTAAEVASSLNVTVKVPPTPPTKVPISTPP
jgi:hypothetical protein